jgi:lysophospholipase L1-like esterase
MGLHRSGQRAGQSRRQFVKAGLGISAAGLAALAAVDELDAEEKQAAETPKPLIEPGQTILFQGDSITDAGRDRERTDKPNDHRALGKGYAWLAAAEMLVDDPEADYKYYNRGISGNKVFQLADRWQADCLDLKPDVLSILIGVNDFWHKLNADYDGTVEKYETGYRALVARTKEALPDVKLILCEPFVLKAGNVDAKWFPEFDGYRAAAARVAQDAGAMFVAFQTMFDRAAKIAPAKHWAEDGVHPSTHGAALMAHWWLKAVGA